MSIPVNLSEFNTDTRDKLISDLRVKATKDEEESILYINWFRRVIP